MITTREAKQYLIDGDPISWQALIIVAENKGYRGEHGLFSTSGAANFLRDLGHEIDKNTDA